MNDNHTYVTFEKLSCYENISHCFTTRKGGVSSGFFSSMNLGFGRGDENEKVMENYRRTAKFLDLSPKELVLSDQIHGDQIYCVSDKDKGKGVTRKSDIIGADGLMTNVPGIGLVTFYADCVPLYFYDPVKEVIAISHSGWRGTVKKIGVKTVLKMKEVYGSKLEDIIVAIGPSVCKACYEVDAEVKKQFDISMNDDIISKVVVPVGSKYHIDLKLANQLSLVEAGVMIENIEMSSYCTKCNSELFFSHRVMGMNRGSQAGILALRK